MRTALMIGALAMVFALAAVSEPADAGRAERLRSAKSKANRLRSRKAMRLRSRKAKQSRSRKVKKQRSRKYRPTSTYGGKKRRPPGSARAEETVGAQTGTATVADLQRRVSSLETKLSRLLKYVKISGGDITIEGTNVDIKGAASVKIDGSAGLKLTSGGATSIKGSLVLFNGGKRPVAGVGDTVQGGKVITGATTVLMD